MSRPSGSLITGREEMGTEEPWYWGGYQFYSVLESIWEQKFFYFPANHEFHDFEWLYVTEQLWAMREDLA